MFVDVNATQLAPDGFIVWRSNIEWQAMASDKSCWGPMRGDVKNAISDAEQLFVEQSGHD